MNCLQASVLSVPETLQKMFHGVGNLNGELMLKIQWIMEEWANRAVENPFYNAATDYKILAASLQ